MPTAGLKGSTEAYSLRRLSEIPIQKLICEEPWGHVSIMTQMGERDPEADRAPQGTAHRPLWETLLGRQSKRAPPEV